MDNCMTNRNDSLMKVMHQVQSCHVSELGSSLLKGCCDHCQYLSERRNRKGNGGGWIDETDGTNNLAMALPATWRVWSISILSEHDNLWLPSSLPCAIMWYTKLEAGTEGSDISELSPAISLFLLQYWVTTYQGDFAAMLTGSKNWQVISMGSDFYYKSA